jgi:hypothetical protein
MSSPGAGMFLRRRESPLAGLPAAWGAWRRLGVCTARFCPRRHAGRGVRPVCLAWLLRAERLAAALARPVGPGQPRGWRATWRVSCRPPFLCAMAGPYPGPALLRPMSTPPPDAPLSISRDAPPQRRGGRKRKHPTFNTQHPTSKLGRGTVDFELGRWVLDVGCWMLDVECWMLDVGCFLLLPQRSLRACGKQAGLRLCGQCKFPVGTTGTSTLPARQSQ